MATIETYGYDELADGAAIPTGGAAFWTSFNTTVHTALAETDAAIDGVRGLRVTNVTAGTLGYLLKTFTATAEAAFTVRMKLPTPPSTGQQRLIDIGPSGSQSMRLDQTSDNRLLVRNAAGTTISSPQMGMAVAGTVGDLLEWRFYVKKGTGTGDGTLHSYLYNLTTSTLIADGSSTALNIGTADFTTLRLGFPLTTNASVTFFDSDTVWFAPDPDSVGWLIDPAAVFGAPTGLTATPVSSTAIDLSWSAVPTATGYDVERDTVVIATDVAATTYSDTGLTASTAYDYRVRAVK